MEEVFYFPLTSLCLVPPKRDRRGPCLPPRVLTEGGAGRNGVQIKRGLLFRFDGVARELHFMMKSSILDKSLSITFWRIPWREGLRDMTTYQTHHDFPPLVLFSCENPDFMAHMVVHGLRRCFSKAMTNRPSTCRGEITLFLSVRHGHFRDARPEGKDRRICNPLELIP